MELRKKKEQQFHNILRSDQLKQKAEIYKHYTSNSKFYSIDRGNKNYVFNWLGRRCRDKKVLDYCCGDGRYAFYCAKKGAETIGIDISEVAIKKCKSVARQQRLNNKTAFFVMDAEEMGFKDNTFDFIICMGVLHHLNFGMAMRELSRVIKHDGEIICTEALGHNPFIRFYRKLTPHLRTKYELNHIIKLPQLDIAREHFGYIKINFFHLSTLAAVPFRNMSIFAGLLSVLETIDNFMLKLPLIKTQAWMIIFELSNPKHLAKLSNKYQPNSKI